MQMTSTMLGYIQSHTRDSGYRGHVMSHNRNTVVDLANCAYCVILFGDILDPTCVYLTCVCQIPCDSGSGVGNIRRGTESEKYVRFRVHQFMVDLFIEPALKKRKLLNAIIVLNGIQVDSHLYYKRGEPYLCSAKAPVLDASGSRR